MAQHWPDDIYLSDNQLKRWRCVTTWKRGLMVHKCEEVVHQFSGRPVNTQSLNFNEKHLAADF